MSASYDGVRMAIRSDDGRPKFIVGKNRKKERGIMTENKRRLQEGRRRFETAKVAVKTRRGVLLLLTSRIHPILLSPEKMIIHSDF